jgi:hypothetical protein
MDLFISTESRREPWNKGQLVGQKAPFKVKEIWEIRVRLQLSARTSQNLRTAPSPPKKTGALGPWPQSSVRSLGGSLSCPTGDGAEAIAPTTAPELTLSNL